MFYHTRPFQYVVYDKVGPAPAEVIDDFFLEAYEWLGQHCGYCPQIWLSRSCSRLTGYRRKEDNILFGFEHVQGFPLKFDIWELVLFSIGGKRKLADEMKYYYQDILDNENAVFQGSDGAAIRDYVEKGEEFFLKNHLFIEHDQVVVPNLNLKTAKKIVCCNEKQAKSLARMGFIKDRIEIRNRKHRR